MLAELRAKLKIGRRSEHKRLLALKHELDKIEIVLDRLYDAVESGRLPQRRKPAGPRPQASDATPGHPARLGALPRRAELSLTTPSQREPRETSID